MVDVTNVLLTYASKDVFIAYAKVASNWNGEPLVGGAVVSTASTRGHLTALKKARLITTFTDEGNTWMQFTELGVAYAEWLGIAIYGHAIPKPEIRLASHSQDLDEWMLRG